jgi:hypothetical protein
MKAYSPCIAILSIFHSWETQRATTLHFIKYGHYCYPAGDIRPEQRTRRRNWDPKGKKMIEWEIGWDGGGTGTKR